MLKPPINRKSTGKLMKYGEGDGVGVELTLERYTLLRGGASRTSAGDGPGYPGRPGFPWKPASKVALAVHWKPWIAATVVSCSSMKSTSAVTS